MSKARELASLGNAYSDGALSNRNLIINGAMQVAQRGTSSASAGYQTVDRWNNLNVTGQSQSSDAPNGFLNSVELQDSVGTFPFIEQRIEKKSCHYLAGQTVTLSFWAKNVSGTSNLYVEIYRANSDDDFSGITFEGGGELALIPSSDWTYYTKSVALSSNATTGLAVRVIRNNTSASTTRITGVQLEVGDTATPFEHRSYGQELALCQRYYHAAGHGTGFLTNSNSGYFLAHYHYPVPMRTTPSCILLKSSGYLFFGSGATTEGTYSFTGIGILNNYYDAASRIRISSSGIPTNASGIIHESEVWAMDAEL